MSVQGGLVRVELRRDVGRVGPHLGPWLRRNQIARFLGAPDPHLLAQVVDHRGEPVGWGLVSAVSSLTVRMLSYGAARPPEDWLPRRLASAFAAREAFGLDAAGTTGYRLVNSEGDGIPGLVVDRYGEALVVQMGTAPIAAREEELGAWLAGQWAGPIHYVVPEGAARFEGMSATARDGSGGTLQFREDGLVFEVPAPPAQKTGAYFDQRDNRRLVAALAAAHGGTLLDLGCHVGGFALHAARSGVDVVALDRSTTALEHARGNAAANGIDRITWVEADMFAPLADPALAGPFGAIVFDPPKLAARRDDVDHAVGAMARVVGELARRLAPRGHLVLCSCSHHVGREHLDRALLQTGLSFTRTLALGAGADHPVALGHREGEYLRVNVYQAR
ncbi:MAG: class I SAM-dependent rRNA methyltransferase [Myxococcales bacterium]|nr:class I SAM-dependent rRNA methyltransferase [Myxococcales bacterium]